MERVSNNNGFVQKQNKGYTIHFGETYVGHLVINEDRVSAQTIANLEVPEKMLAVLAQSKLRKFVPAEERTKRDTSGIDDLMATVAIPAQAEAEPAKTPQEEAEDIMADNDGTEESPLGDGITDDAVVAGQAG